MHFCRPWRKYVQFQKVRYKILWGVEITRYQLSIHLRSENVHKVQKKWQKLKQGLYQMKKTCVKFQKDRYEIVWGVVLTRYPLSMHWGWKMTKFTLWKKWQKWSNNYIQTTCTSLYHEENTCKVSKQPVQNCKRSCAHKIPRVNVDERADGNLRQSSPATAGATIRPVWPADSDQPVHQPNMARLLVYPSSDS